MKYNQELKEDYLEIESNSIKKYFKINTDVNNQKLILEFNDSSDSENRVEAEYEFSKI